MPVATVEARCTLSRNAPSVRWPAPPMGCVTHATPGRKRCAAMSAR